MARIRTLAPGTQKIHAHDSKVDCSYNVIDEGGERLLHLSTFGSDTRRSKPKSSQSIQIDYAMAKELFDVVVETFPSLVTASRNAEPIKKGAGDTETAPIFNELSRLMEQHPGN